MMQGAIMIENITVPGSAMPTQRTAVFCVPLTQRAPDAHHHPTRWPDALRKWISWE
jgi:hypothetical protein